MALCQKFSRLLIGAEAPRFFARTDVANISTSLHRSSAQAPSPVRLPSGYKAPSAFALFIKEYMTGQGGDTETFKIASTNWQNLSKDEKQNYLQSAKKIADELRAKFEKLPNDQKKALLAERVERQDKLQLLQEKREQRKFHEETGRPKQPITAYMRFIKENLEKQSESFKNNMEQKQFFVDLGKQWRQMTDAEKKPYVAEAQVDFAAFYMRLTKWDKENANEAWKKKNEEKTEAAPKGMGCTAGGLKRRNNAVRGNESKGNKKVKKSDDKETTNEKKPNNKETTNEKVKKSDDKETTNEKKPNNKETTNEKVKKSNDKETTTNEKVKKSDDKEPTNKKVPDDKETTNKKVKKSDVKGAVD
uniref:HMG box domain-containing protein n=1 Tax=Globodera rostochiensis TaxID=31243 RepID=A0A914I905_GLORO